MGFRLGWISRQLVLPIAKSPAMVYREYWLPSYPPPGSPDTQLPSGKMPSGESYISAGKASDDFEQLEIAALSPMG